MKKTLNINIGSRVFNIDEDAYDLLSKYLESIKKYFEKIKIDEDIFEDIENRISEKFASTLDKRQSLNIDDINNIVKEMGTLEDFKEAYTDFETNESKDALKDNTNIIFETNESSKRKFSVIKKYLKYKQKYLQLKNLVLYALDQILVSKKYQTNFGKQKH